MRWCSARPRASSNIKPTAPRTARCAPSTPRPTNSHVSFREADIIGLALSGGGIRSATFNLGLLQELHCIGLLPLVDYVSTVSGGGYVGSFWSAWLKRLKKRLGESGSRPDSPEWNAERKQHLFPTVHDQAPQQPHLVESDEERHLREFSGFLAPRWGFFEVETWTAIVALLSGLVPALLIGLSVIGVTLIAWLALTFPLASGEAEAAPALAIAVISAAVFILFEKMWQGFRRETAGHSANQSADEAAAAARGTRAARCDGCHCRPADRGPPVQAADGVPAVSRRAVADLHICRHRGLARCPGSRARALVVDYRDRQPGAPV